MREKKKELRRHIRGRENPDGNPDRAGEENPWTETAFARAGLGRFGTLFTFLSFPTEPDTKALNALALELGLDVAAPRVHGSVMGFYRIDSAAGPFAVGPYGILEPQPEARALWEPGADAARPGGSAAIRLPLLVAVPGLAFARDGRRLGRGGGYYDRFIGKLLGAFPGSRDAITLMGLCAERDILPDIPVESHDARVDCLLTEMRYIICNDFREDEKNG